jgi:hypothetical protein
MDDLRKVFSASTRRGSTAMAVTGTVAKLNDTAGN